MQVAYHAVQNLHLIYLGQFFAPISSLLVCFVEILILLILWIFTSFFIKMFNWKLTFLSDIAQENDLLIGPSFDKINWFQLQNGLLIIERITNFTKGAMAYSKLTCKVWNWLRTGHRDLTFLGYIFCTDPYGLSIALMKTKTQPVIFHVLSQQVLNP